MLHMSSKGVSYACACDIDLLSRIQASADRPTGADKSAYYGPAALLSDPPRTIYSGDDCLARIGYTVAPSRQDCDTLLYCIVGQDIMAPV